MRSKFAASRMAENWLDQFVRLKADLESDPQNGRAWLWRIRLKVLMYVLLRYGRDPLLDRSAASDDAAAGLIPQYARTVSTGLPVRTRGQLRTILDHIAEINRFKTI